MPQPEVTTEVTLACSYCGELTTVPLKIGAVMPRADEGVGVHAWLSGDGGDHECASERFALERRIWEESTRKLYIPEEMSSAKD